MSNVVVLPSTLDGIKRLAKTIKRERGLPHHAALDEAARSAGYENIRHAQHALASAPRSPRGHAVFLTAYWAQKGGAGRETMRLTLPAPLTQVATRTELRSGRNLGGFRLEYEDHLELELDARSQAEAQGRLEDAARTLAFMTATNLVPATGALDRKLDHLYSRLPGRDHPSTWVDRETKQGVYLDEPYDHVRPEQRAEWCATKGFQMVTSEWEGLYSPGNSTPYLFCESVALADRLREQLLALPRRRDAAQGHDPVVESGPYRPYVSPARERDGKARRARPMPAPRGIVRNNALPYGNTSGGMASRWRPATPLALEAHLRIGPLLAALANSDLPVVADRAVCSTRSELDDWLQMEYRGDAMTPEQFHAAYYGEHRPGIPGKPAQLAALDQVIETLRRGYPDCPPLREVLKRLSKARDRVAVKA